MPSFRGVEISIVVNPGAKKLREYPHPDGSSVHLMRVDTGLSSLRNQGQTDLHPSASPICSEADPTRQKKLNPRISVYIPSSPGDQFRLRYQVNQSPPPSRFIFFKMFINGHHTVSWGIDTNNCSAGSVSRSLYGPGDRFRDRNGDAIVGIETRYFHFMRGLDRESVAEDGGLIEVQVFRCRGRNRIAVALDTYPHRYQGRYGIASLSGGLVENPQDATSYEYHLDDGKESPYATFCFHYRSTKHLEQLNLIPQHEIRRRPISINPGKPLGLDSRMGSSNATSTPPPGLFVFGVESPDAEVFKDDIKVGSISVSEPYKALIPGPRFLKSPPRLPPARLSSLAREDTELAQRNETMAEILQRPLPELPRNVSRQASKESLWSNCPSLTPSLKQYVESEEFEDEEIRLSTAQPIFIQPESTQALELSEGGIHDQEEDSFSDYAVSPTCTETSQSPVLPSPEGYVPTTGSVLERHLTQLDSPGTSSSPKAKANVPICKAGRVLTSDVYDGSTDELKLTESEWLRRTPSPLRHKGRLVQRVLWNSQPEKAAERSSMIELSAWEDKGRNDKEYNTDEVPAGNWI